MRARDPGTRPRGGTALAGPGATQPPRCRIAAILCRNGTEAGMSGAMTDGERIAWIDTAKGVCIVLVVMMHATLGVGEAYGGEGFLHHAVAFAKPFRMPDFFLISGLFLA